MSQLQEIVEPGVLQPMVSQIVRQDSGTELTLTTTKAGVCFTIKTNDTEFPSCVETPQLLKLFSQLFKVRIVTNMKC